jgi:hypothetical protein
MLNTMKKILNPKNLFLMPIILTMIVSMAHVIKWYDMSNPLSWAIFMSISIEVGAMTSIIARNNRINNGIWFMFGLVTFIQLMGNIFYSYNEIDKNSDLFKDWVELSSPLFEMLGSNVSDLVAQRRWLALLQGGLLPMISLASLNFFIKYGGMDDEPVVKVEERPIEETKEEIIEPNTEKTSTPPLEAKIETDNNGNFRFY